MQQTAARPRERMPARGRASARPRGARLSSTIAAAACAVAVLWQPPRGGAGAYHMSLDLSHPPFLHRSDDASLLQWDTGDIARILALSQAVAVNYQGLYTIPLGFHMRPPPGARDTAVACVEAADKLCTAPNGSISVLPNKGRVLVPSVADSPGLPRVAKTFMQTGCSAPAMGSGRVVADNQTYDVSACDVNAMAHTLLLHDDVLYTVAIPTPMWLHFLLCVSCMGTLSLILYILRPEQAEEKRAKNGDRQATDVGLANTALAVAVTCVCNTLSPPFVTSEDVAGFVLVVLVYAFYLAAAVVRRAGPAQQYEMGVVVDCCIACISVVCIGAYATLQHPFNAVTTWATLFRMWNKLMRFSFGHGYNPNALFTVLRLVLDSFIICCAVTYGWGVSFLYPTDAAFWFLPMLAVAYIVAKFVFLSHTHIS